MRGILEFIEQAYHMQCTECSHFMKLCLGSIGPLCLNERYKHENFAKEFHGHFLKILCKIL